MKTNILFRYLLSCVLLIVVARESLSQDGHQFSSATSAVPASPLVASHREYLRMKGETPFGIDWISLGPTVNSARVEAVQLHPAQPGVMYAAFGSGGLWKSKNNGMSWESIFDSQASYGIGDIALAPSNPEIIYLGTGESLKKARNFTIPGTGVYRSDNGGQDWRYLGLPDSWHIGEIAVHPNDPDRVLVAVLGHFWSENPNRGLYLTTDGGETWEQVLSVDSRTGANDVVWAIDDPNVVYASMWHNYPDVCGSNSAVFRSADSGTTWQPCSNGLPSGETIGRIGLAVSQSNSQTVYALVDDRGRIQQGAARLFVSRDGGNSWRQTHEKPLKIFSGIGWYFADLYVNPQDDQEVFALGVRVAHSTDGGQTFELLGGKVTHLVPSAASGLHLDHCEMWINPNNPLHLVLANDGGLYQSFDKGQTWLHYNNLPAGEFYDITLDSRFPYNIYAGAQDDATVYGPARELGPARIEPWKYLWIDPWNGGDGCVTQIDPTDPNTVYFSAQEGAFRRKDMQNNTSQPIPAKLPEGYEGELQFNFVAPFLISPHDPHTLYLGGNYIFRSRNRGDEWQVVSPNLSNQDKNSRNATATSALAESPLVRGLLFAGTDKGTFWISRDNGQTWKQHSEDLPVGYVRCIVPSKFDSSTVYLAMSGLNYDDLATHLFSSKDGGETWNSIAANLPREPANVIVEDCLHPDLLYVGTFRGVYVSIDRGRSWSLLGKNMPACSIADIEIQEREQDLVVATHGRGVYRFPLRPLHEFVKGKGNGKANGLMPPPPAELPHRTDTRPGLNFREIDPVTFSFWVEDAGPVKLSVSERGGKISREFSIEASRGLNQLRWNLVTEETNSPDPYFIRYRTHLKPGTYQVQLQGESFGPIQQNLQVTAEDPTTNR